MEFLLIIAFLVFVLQIFVYFVYGILYAGFIFLANLGLMDASLIPSDAGQLLDVVGVDGVIAGPIVTILVIYVLSRSGIIDLSTIFFRKEK